MMISGREMNMGFVLLGVLIMLPAGLLAGDLPLAVTKGEVIVSENFSLADAMASWRWGAGKWLVGEGVLKGTETTERKHAAGIACQREYHDAVIKFRFQFTGGKRATLLLRNKFGNLCRVVISQSSMVMTKDKPNLPKDTVEKTLVLGTAKVELKRGQWYDLSAVVQGERFAVTLHGHATLKGRHAAIDVDKTEIEFLAAGDSILFDDLEAWRCVAVDSIREASK